MGGLLSTRAGDPDTDLDDLESQCTLLNTRMTKMTSAEYVVKKVKFIADLSIKTTLPLPKTKAACGLKSEGCMNCETERKLFKT